MQANTPPSSAVALRCATVIINRASQARDTLKDAQTKISERLVAGYEINTSELEGLLKAQVQVRVFSQLGRRVEAAVDLQQVLKDYLDDGLDTVLSTMGSSTSAVINEANRLEREAVMDAVKLVRQLLERMQ